ncbi:MAG: ATP-binding protein [Candidatus Marsarchaeota archaeon]|jgi:PAS domain S-box-containing protein|nr:ATP-binding protein [Candidatus Marsarchaeota archaeon]MCL5111538.1 ATP-binding protein [Candidatus Marsarchaeota archaeon]
MEGLPSNRFVAGLASLAGSGVTRDEMIKYFTKLVEESYGVEKVSIRDVDGISDGSAVCTQLISTRKPFVDNNLSEYSMSPELAGYGSSGYRSYAAVPILADGRVVSMLEMLSHMENRFTDDAMRDISVSALLIGFALAYKAERNRSTALAGYFDAVFNSGSPQMLVSPDGKIVKANKAAIRNFRVQQGAEIKSALGVDYGTLMSMAGSHGTIAVEMDGASRAYSAAVSKASDALLHVSLQDVSDVSAIRGAMQSISQSADTMILFTDALLNMVDATDSFEKILGYERRIMMGKPIADIISDKRREDFAASLKGDDKKASVGRTDVVSIGGYPIRMHYSAVKSVGGYSIMFTRSDAEKYVEDLREGFNDFIANAAEMVIRVDGMGYITSCNLATESTLGYAREDLVGKEIRSVYKDQAIVDRDMAYARNLGKPDNSYVDLLGKNGEIVPGTQSIRFLTDQDGNSEYVIVIRELLTKRILDDRELALSKMEREMKQLRSTGELKSQFIYNISHELKTPMTNIKGFAKLLYSGEFGQLNDDQKQYIQTISDEADRLMLIIQQVLDSAKLDAQKIKLELKDVDLNSMQDNPSIVALKESAEEKGLSFKWDVAYDVPTVKADPNRLIQIFVNLIGNSIKFTERGGIHVKISKKTKGKVQCDIIDTGIGISEEDRHRLFRKFYQVQAKKDLVKQDGAGTGLGLSITKELVKLHSGEISFESQPGKGTRFWFTLRIKPKARRQKQPSGN